MGGIGELSVSITARTEKAQRKIKSFRKSMNALPGVIGGAARSMGGLATAAAGLLGVGAIGHEINQSFSNIDNLAKTSDKLDIATEKLSALRFAAEENGVASDTTDMALQRMVRRIAEAANGSGEAVGALNELGLSAQKLAKMTPDQQFAELAESMKGVEGQGDRVRLSMKLFDSEGVALVNTLRMGKEGLSAYEKEAQRLGIAVSRVDAAQIEKANDAFGRIGKVTEGLTNQIAIGLAPVVEGVANSITDWATNTESSSGKIKSSIRGIAGAVGFVGDGIDFWLRSFKSVRAYVSEFLSWASEQFAKFSNTLSEVLNKIPGVETEPLEFTSTFAEEMAKQAKEARKAADEAWRKPLPSAGIDKFFDNVKTQVEESRKAFDEAAKQKEVLANATESFGDPSKGIGSFIAGAAKSIKEMAGKGIASIDFNQFSKIDVGLPTTAEKGSREEFQLISQMQNQEERRTDQRHSEQISVLGSIRDQLAKWTPSMQLPEGMVKRTTEDSDSNSLLSGLGPLVEMMTGKSQPGDGGSTNQGNGTSSQGGDNNAQLLVSKEIAKNQTQATSAAKESKAVLDRLAEIMERVNEGIGKVESAVAGQDLGGAV